MRSRSRREWLSEDDLEEVLPAVSTSSQAFAAILDDLVRTVDAPEMATGLASGPASGPASAGAPDDLAEVLVERATLVLDAPPRPAGPPPARLRGRGDLTLVIGLGADALAAARVLADSAEADVLPVTDRREALAARADGVRRERAVVGVVELPRTEVPQALAADLAGVAPDQVWVAVDVSRKPEDTAAWVRAVDGVLAVDAVAATGGALTASPASVHLLGLPVLWLDEPPAG